MFSPDAEELGKYRGYIEPAKFRRHPARGRRERRDDERRRRSDKTRERDRRSRKAPRPPLSEEQPRVDPTCDRRRARRLLGPERGRLGPRAEGPVGWRQRWLDALEGEHGDAPRSRRSLFTLEQQSKLLDPVWGGIYQYSAAEDWDDAALREADDVPGAEARGYAVAYRARPGTRSICASTRSAIAGYIDTLPASARGRLLHEPGRRRERARPQRPPSSTATTTTRSARRSGSRSASRGSTRTSTAGERARHRCIRARCTR